jgi:hypothetical protein
LRVGTLLQFAGYDWPRFAIADKLGINDQLPTYGMKYKVVNLEL